MSFLLTARQSLLSLKKRKRKKERKEKGNTPDWLVAVCFMGTARSHLQPAFDSQGC